MALECALLLEPRPDSSENPPLLLQARSHLKLRWEPALLAKPFPSPQTAEIPPRSAVLTAALTIDYAENPPFIRKSRPFRVCWEPALLDKPARP